MTTMAMKAKEVLDFAAEKLDICLKKEILQSCVCFVVGKGCRAVRYIGISNYHGIEFEMVLYFDWQSEILIELLKQ